MTDLHQGKRRYYAACWGGLSAALHAISFEEREGGAGSGLLSLVNPASHQACRSALNMTFFGTRGFSSGRVCSSSTHVR